VPVVTTGEVDQQWGSREISEAVGGAHRGSSLYAMNDDLVATLAPDVVLTQELCEVCAVSYSQVSATVRMLESGPEVLSLEPRTLDEVLDTLRVVGAALNVEDTAMMWLAELQSRLDTVQQQV